MSLSLFGLFYQIVWVFCFLSCFYFPLSQKEEVAKEIFWFFFFQSIFSFQEYECLEQENTSLKREIGKLTDEMKHLSEVLRDHEKICPLLHCTLNFGLMPRHDVLSGPLPRWSFFWNEKAVKIDHLLFTMQYEHNNLIQAWTSFLGATYDLEAILQEAIFMSVWTGHHPRGHWTELYVICIWSILILRSLVRPAHYVLTHWQWLSRVSGRSLS